MLPNAPDGELPHCNPVLPAFLDELTMAVGDARVPVHFASSEGGNQPTLVDLVALERGARPLQVRIDLG